MTMAMQWHAFNVHTDEDLYAVMTVGPTEYGADDVPDGADCTVRDHKIEIPTLGALGYRTSFDHEPTRADLDALAPDGHKSWQAAEDT